MLKIFKYLGEAKAAVIAIILLLIVQAYCDLALPQYTSDIVDVGIQQGGIENVAPDEMSKQTYEELTLFMTEEELSYVESFYSLQGELYYRNEASQENIEKLNTIFGAPMLLVSYLDESGKMNAQQVLSMKEAGKISKDQLLEMREQSLEKLGTMSDSIISQKALLFVKNEYKEIGLDLDKMQTNYLIRTGGKMLGFAIIIMITAIIVGFLASRTAAGIGKNLRRNVFEKVVSFSNTEIDQFSSASLITRSTNDIQQVQMVTVMMLRMVVYAPILAIGGVIKVAGTKTGMGWIVGVAVGLILLLVFILMQIAMPKFKSMQKLVDRLNLVSREILTGITVIRAFGREEFEEKRFETANRDLMSTQLFTNRVMTFMIPLMTLIMNGVTILIVWFGGKGIDQGHLQVGDMMAFITYTMQIVMSFLMLAMISIMLPRAGVAAERINEVIEKEATIKDKEKVRDEELSACRGEITFDQVSFHYPDAGENALEKISFQAKPGETTAIIGSTGCGKSTMIHLINRFYEVSEGRILLDGIDIRDLSQKKLRSVLGLVPQKGILFSGNIESNIKYAGEWISDEDMKAAAKIAQAEDFIEEKPEHYQSEISQGGTNVSGGQKQRLSIARVIAKKPKVYLFDDSFSALDYKTDISLRKALKEQTAEATVIIVAQRISTIMHSDRIIVLDEGRIVGNGTHEELLQSCEEYKEIANSQLSEAELKGGRA